MVVDDPSGIVIKFRRITQMHGSCFQFFSQKLFCQKGVLPMILRWMPVAAVLLFVGVFAAGARAQTAGAPGCGAPEQKFDVTTAKDKAEIKAVPGKALLLVLQNDSIYASRPRPTNRIGVDGKWVGATHGETYLSVQLEPGEHHLCSSWQSSTVFSSERTSAAAHFTAEPNGVYYYEVKDSFVPNGVGGAIEVKLNLLDSDEGQLMVNDYKQAQAKLKE